MSALDLARVRPGFADPVFESQAAFRACLAALSRPGTVQEAGAGLQPVPGLQEASSALLLALLDGDTRLWLSPGCAAGASPSLRFHTGCGIAISPGEADFALVGDPGELPSLDAFDAGSDEYPDRSATVVLQVPALLEAGWRLTGPGIPGDARLSVPALGAGFLAQWNRNRARFPRGVDLFLTCGARLCGLPRTTRIES